MQPGQPSATEVITLSDGAQIVLRRHGNPSGERLALSHGNGLAIQGYAVFWEVLCEEFDLVLFDMRNHGQNPLHDEAAHNWDRVTQDMGEIRLGIDQAFGRRTTTGVFHSMSAVAALQQVTDSTASATSYFDGLVLFDPPIFAPQGHARHAMAFAGTEMLAKRTARRPQTYADPMALAAQFKGKRAFKNWAQGAAEDMANATLVRDATEQGDPPCWSLACPREYEAKMYETNRDPALWHRLLRPVSTPFRVIGADPTLTRSEAPALVCQALAEVATIDYTFVPDTSHFLQIEKTTQCVSLIQDFVRSVSS